MKFFEKYKNQNQKLQKLPAKEIKSDKTKIKNFKK
jgi:hypothetical protein